MNMKRKQAVVMRAPRLEGDSIPSMATTVEGGGEEKQSGRLTARGPGQMRLDEAPFSLGLPDSILPCSLQKTGLSWGSLGSSRCWPLAGPIFTAASSPQAPCNQPGRAESIMNASSLHLPYQPYDVEAGYPFLKRGN